MIITIVLGILFLSPIIGLLAQSNMDTMKEVLSSPSNIGAIWTTIFTGVVSSFLSVVGGIYFGRYFAFHQWRAKRFYKLMLLFPYLVPNYILAAAYVVAWNPGTGLLNNFIPFYGGLYSEAGIIALFSITHFPVAFLLIEEKLRRIDSSWREAANICGASSFTTFWKIELPLLKPVILSSFILCFSLCLSSFAIPAWIGAPEKVYTLTYKIYQTVQLYGPEGLPASACLSLFLFAITAPLIILSTAGSGKNKKYAFLSGKSGRAPAAHGRLPWHFFFIFFVSQMLFWVLPFLSQAISTLVPPGCLQMEPLACVAKASMRSYHYVLYELTETQLAFKGSFLYGTLSAVVILFICILVLVFLSKNRQQLKIIEWVFFVPIATPGAIIALGLIVVYSGNYFVNLYNTAWIVVIAYVVKHMNLAYQSIQTGYMNISSTLLEAGRVSGASHIGVWRRIVLPILRPDCLGGFFLVLIPILGELTMSVFLANPSFRSLGTVLFDLQDYADQTSAAALAMVIAIIVLLLNEITRKVSKGKLGY